MGISGIMALVAAALSLAGAPRRSRLRMAMLHNGAWALGLAVVASGLLRFHPIQPETWRLIIGAFVLFNFGVFLTGGETRQYLQQATDSNAARPLMTLWMFLAMCVGFFIGAVMLVRSIVASFGLATLLQDPRAIRASTDVAYLENFSLAGKLLFYLGPLVFVLCLFPRFVLGLERRIWRLPLLVIIGLVQLVSLQRTNLFVGLLWGMGLLLLGSPHIAERSQLMRRIMLSAVVIGVGLGAFQFVANALGKTAQDNASLVASVDPRIAQSSFLMPMFYSASGIPAFNALAMSQNEEWPPDSVNGAPVRGDFNPQTYGKATFNGPLKLMPGIEQPWNEVAPFVDVPQQTNVYTWLEPWYRDFRAPGVYGFAFVIGLLLGWVGRFRVRSPELELMAAMLLGLSGLATFVNRYGMVMTVEAYGVLLLLGFIARRHSKLKAGGAAPAEARSSIRVAN